MFTETLRRRSMGQHPETSLSILILSVRKEYDDVISVLLDEDSATGTRSLATETRHAVRPCSSLQDVDGLLLRMAVLAERHRRSMVGHLRGSWPGFTYLAGHLRALCERPICKRPVHICPGKSRAATEAHALALAWGSVDKDAAQI